MPRGKRGMQTIRSDTMVVGFVGRYVVFVHGKAAPGDDEWEQSLSFYREAPDARQVRALVYTEGGAPNAAQRAKLNAVLGGRKLPIAVLTTSSIARAAGTAISWF